MRQYVKYVAHHKLRETFQTEDLFTNVQNLFLAPSLNNNIKRMPGESGAIYHSNMELLIMVDRSVKYNFLLRELFLSEN